MNYETLIYEPAAVARVILNRPNKHNAQSWKLLEEMDAAFDAAVKDPQVRVIVLSGYGPSFSAGHDLDSDEALEYRKRVDVGDDFVRSERFRDIYIESHLRWRNLAKPTIAMVHGYCIYGGWMIAATMDVVFASDDSLFVPSIGDYFTPAWDVGARKAKEILFENRFMTAEEAKGSGFVNQVWPADQLEENTLRYASRVAKGDPQIHRRAKLAINQVLDGMGFSDSVRAITPEVLNLINSSLPNGYEDGAVPHGGRIRARVADVRVHMREDKLATPTYSPTH